MGLANDKDLDISYIESITDISTLKKMCIVFYNIMLTKSRIERDSDSTVEDFQIRCASLESENEYLKKKLKKMEDEAKERVRDPQS